MLTKHPHYKHFLTSRRVREKERIEAIPGVFVTVLDASKQSRVRVSIEQPLGVSIGHGAGTQDDAEVSDAAQG